MKTIRRGVLWTLVVLLVLTALPLSAMATDERASDTVLSKHYFYDQLAPWEQMIYDAVLESPLGQGPTPEEMAVDLSLLPEDERTITVAMILKRTGELSFTRMPAQSEPAYSRWQAALEFDHPELSWTQNTINSFTFTPNGQYGNSAPPFFQELTVGESREYMETFTITSARFSLGEVGYAMATTSCDAVSGEDRFHYADTRDLKTIQAAIESAKKDIGSLAGTPDWEKVRAVHDWILDNVDYTDEEGERFLNGWRGYQTPYSALIDGITVCAGFQKAFKLLCEEYEVPCVSVHGDETEDSCHMWGNVLIDGKWYGVDCTSDEYERNHGRIGYEQFLKGSGNFEHIPAAGLWDQPAVEMDYPELNDVDYPIPEPEPEIVEANGIRVLVYDAQNIDSASVLSSALLHRREHVGRTFGAENALPAGSTVHLYSSGLWADSEINYLQHIALRVDENGPMLEYGGVKYDGEMDLVLPDDPEIAERVISNAADAYAVFLLRECGVRKSGSDRYWYGWVFDGLLRYVDGVQLDAELIRTDIASGDVPRPFVIGQIKDNARREAYEEAGIGFLKSICGIENIRALLRSGDAYEEVLGMKNAEIADAWTEYMERLYGKAAEATEHALTVSGTQVLGPVFGTTSGALIASMEQQKYSSVSVADSAGAALDAGEQLATGMTITGTAPNGSRNELTIIVRGDVLGTGRMSLSQLVTLCGAFTGRTDLGAYEAAGDWTGDGAISLSDIVAAAQALQS